MHMDGYSTLPGLSLEWIYDQPFLIAGRAARRRLPAVTPLNSTAARIWDALRQGKDPERIAQELAADYGLEQEHALSDVTGFCKQLLEAGYLISREKKYAC